MCVCVHIAQTRPYVFTLVLSSLSPPTHTHAHGKVEKRGRRAASVSTLRVLHADKSTIENGRPDKWFFYYFQTDGSVLFFKYYINTCHFYRYLSQTLSRWGVVIVVGAVVALKNPTQKREIVYNFYYSLSMSII
jgi:hypothetical protein